MAVFPDRIVFKTSRDNSAEILTAIQSGGSDQIVDGEIVLGLESGKVKLYARDANGLVIPVLPDPPGYDVSGNSIFDLADVSLPKNPAGELEPLEAGHVLQYFDGFWSSSFLDYEVIENAPKSLDDLENPNENYLTTSNSNLDRLTNLDQPSVAGAEDGYYLQYDATIEKWKAVDSISFDISGNSIQDLSDVDYSSPPTDTRCYLQFLNNAWTPSVLEIRKDSTPELGGNLDIKNYNIHSVGSCRIRLEDRSEAQLIIEQGKTEDPGQNEPTGIKIEDERLHGKHSVSILTSKDPATEIDPDTAMLRYFNYSMYLPSVAAPDNSVMRFADDGQGEWIDYDIGLLKSVEIEFSTLQDRSVLAWDALTSKWKNVLAPPADLSGSSIGQLQDVTFTPGGVLSIDNLNSILFTGSDVPEENTNALDSSGKGFSLGQYRTADGLGSYVYAHRDDGIELNSSAAVVRITGDTSVQNNRTQLRWESGNVVEFPTLTPYVSLGLSNAHNHQIDYIWPTVAPVGDQALFANEDGTLVWRDVVLDLSGSLDLGSLSDVDLTTPVPLDGMVLTYSGDAQVGWVAAYPPEQIGRLEDLQDIDLGDGPSNKDFLRYNVSTARWETSTGPEKDWIIESAIQFFTEFNTSVSGVIPSGSWRVNSPLLQNATELAVSVFSAEGYDMSYLLTDVYTEGRQLLFESYDNANTHFMATVQGIVDAADNQITMSIVVDSYSLSFNLGERCMVSLVGGGGSGSGGSGGSATLEELEDTNFSPLTLADKAVLEYNQSTALWESGQAIPRALSALTDVDLQSDLPEIGQSLTWNGASWVPGAGGGGGGEVNAKATDRVSVEATVAAVESGEDRTLTVTSLGSSGNFLSIEVDKAAWVRCYSSLSALTADSGRTQDTDPVLGDGVLLEFVTAGPRSENITPGTTYFNAETLEELQGNIYFAVRNLGDETEDISLKVVAYSAVVASLAKGRTAVTSTTSLVGAGESYVGKLENTGKMGSFVSVFTDAPAWITFYASSEARDSDASRAREYAPLSGSGVLLELMTQSGTVYEITPQRGYFNNDPIPQDSIHYKIVNDAPVDKVIKITSVVVPLEGQILNAITGTITTVNGGTFG